MLTAPAKETTMARDKGFKKSMGDSDENQGDMEVSPFPPSEDQHGWAPDSGETGPELTQGGNRAFEGRDTQAASRSKGGAIYKPSKGAKYVGHSINAQGNKRALRLTEKGRIFQEEEGADRPVGTSTARFASGVNPLESITSEGHLPPTGH
jgi:hypothetical protein